MKIKIYLIIFAVLLVTLISVNCISTQGIFEKYLKNEIIKEDNHFKIIYKGESKYHYIIYNKEKKIVKESEQYRTEPIINYIDESIIEILISAGTSTFFCIYYNILSDKFSEQYESPITANYGKIAYLDYDKYPFRLIIGDIFDINTVYNEFYLDISFAVSPIIESEFLDEDSLYIKYMSGELYEEKDVILEID